MYTLVAVRPRGIPGLALLLLRRRADLRVAVLVTTSLAVALLLALTLTPAPAPTTMTHREMSPTIVSNGGGFAVAWTDTDSDRPAAYHRLYFARLDAHGQRLGARTEVPLAGRGLRDPQLVWNGHTYGLLFVGWKESRRDPRYELYFARLDAGGAVLGAPSLVSDPDHFAHEPRLLWAGGAYHMAWTYTAPGAGVARARMSAEGRWIDPPRRVYEGYAYDLAAAAEGTREVLAWRGGDPGQPEPLHVRWLDEEGERSTDFVPGRDPFGSLQVSLDGPRTTVLWVSRDHRAGAYTIAAAAVSPAGRGEVRALFHGGIYAGLWLARGRDESLLGWTDVVDRETHTFGVALRPDGSAAGPPWRADDSPRLGGMLRLAASGDGYGAVWIDGRDGGTRVYFARFDADGTRRCPSVPVSE